jgi:hypothetical protein
MQTQRKFTDIETGKTFNLHMNPDTHKFKLIYESSTGGEDHANGTEVNGFYINNTGEDVFIKLQNKEIKTVPTGYFLNINPDNQPTHKRHAHKQRFVKY